MILDLAQHRRYESDLIIDGRRHDVRRLENDISYNEIVGYTITLVFTITE